jgi:dolichol-phosphate mannosyltransferase
MNTKNNELISIIVPILNEEDNIQTFVDEVNKVLGDTSLEIIFCCDPSTDKTEEILEELAQKDPSKIKSLIFSRNFGQNSAILAGLSHSKGSAAIIMDVDGQDPVQLLPEFLKKWREGSKLVVGRRVSRKGETYIKKIISKKGLNLINKFSNISIENNIGEFRLIDQSIIKELLSFKEANPFVRGLLELVGYKKEYVDFVRLERKLGKTKYNKYTGSLTIGIKGLTSLSNKLLYVSAYFGLVSAFLSVVLGLAYLYFKINGIIDFPIGNPTIVILILFIGGVQLLSIGIIGIYVGQIFDNVKNRPRYIVSKYLGTFDKPV